MKSFFSETTIKSFITFSSRIHSGFEITKWDYMHCVCFFNVTNELVQQMNEAQQTSVTKYKDF